jgi:hypothetical protein
MAYRIMFMDEPREGGVMKKCFFFSVVLFVLAVVLSANAQPQVGIVGGLNIANADVDEADDDVDLNLDNRICFGIGGHADFNLTEKAVLRLEPMYLQKGAREEETIPGFGNVEAEWRLTYLEVPAFLKFDIGSGPTKPYVLVGPTIGFLLSSKYEQSMGDVSVEIDTKDVTKSFDFGIGFGGGISFPVGNKTVFAEGRYVLGLMNIVDEGTVNVGGELVEITGEAKDKGFQLMAGITFPLGG